MRPNAKDNFKKDGSQHMDESWKEKAKEDALDRLIKLGDMMGDGCPLEPKGKGINKEYRKAMVEAGLINWLWEPTSFERQWTI